MVERAAVSISGPGTLIKILTTQKLRSLKVESFHILDFYDVHFIIADLKNGTNILGGSYSPEDGNCKRYTTGS